MHVGTSTPLRKQDEVRLEEGKPGAPTQNVDEADSKKWKEMHDEHKDNFKSTADVPDSSFTRMVDTIRDNAEAMLKQVESVGWIQ